MKVPLGNFLGRVMKEKHINRQKNCTQSPTSFICAYTLGAGECFS